MRGRKPKPTAVKKLEGNPGKRAFSDAEPQPDSTMPERPKGLTAGARKAWDRLAPELHRIGILTTLDGDQLESYARVYAHAAECWRKSKAEGPVLEREEKLPRPNPYITAALQAEAHLSKLRAEMGLSPVSRTRINANVPEEEQGLLDEYLETNLKLA